MQADDQLQPQNEIADTMSTLPPADVTGSADPSSLVNHDGQALESAVRAVGEYISRINREDLSWLRLRLSPATHEKLVAHFSDDLDSKNWRHDYFLADQEFTMGAETRTHAVFGSLIGTDITNQLQALYNDQDPSVKKFAQDIVKCDSAGIQLSLQGTSPEHSPDTSFTHRLAEHPGVVFEVAHSQPAGHLVRLAQEYILGSKGNICCVVGLKLQYPAGKEAAVSVWERSLTALDNGNMRLDIEQTTANQIFRTDNGLPNPASPGINIPLTHLAPTPDIAKQIQNAPENSIKIQITARDLCKYLNEAEELNATAASGGLKYVADGKLEIVYPEMPAAEEISSEREMQVTKDEEKANLRCEHGDPDYVD